MRPRKDGFRWSVTAHVCVACMGRILERHVLYVKGDPSRERVYRCADCGLEKDGTTPAVLCACGLKLKGRHNLGIRCEVNTERCPEFPSEIIARQA